MEMTGGAAQLRFFPIELADPTAAIPVYMSKGIAQKWRVPALLPALACRHGQFVVKARGEGIERSACIVRRDAPRDENKDAA